MTEKKRETTPEGYANQTNTGSGTHSEAFKEEVFETPRGGSTSGSMTTNTNNKSKSTKTPVPKIALQLKRNSLSETAEKSEGKEFPKNRTTCLQTTIPNKKCVRLINKTTEIERRNFI